MKLQQNKISLTFYFELTQSNEKQESDEEKPEICELCEGSG